MRTLNNYPDILINHLKNLAMTNVANTPQKVKVMVIEDNLPMQMVLKHHLQNNFEVQVFNDGIEAMAYLYQGNLPDIILSDFHTPNLSGYELINQFKSSGFFSSIPIIVLSGEENTETRIKCLESGAEDYILKPFNPKELLVRLNVVLRRTGKLALN
jgi:DNA-binding response OmpR family regulator